MILIHYTRCMLFTEAVFDMLLLLSFECTQHILLVGSLAELDKYLIVFVLKGLTNHFWRHSRPLRHRSRDVNGHLRLYDPCVSQVLVSVWSFSFIFYFCYLHFLNACFQSDVMQMEIIYKWGYLQQFAIQNSVKENRFVLIEASVQSLFSCAL